MKLIDKINEIVKKNEDFSIEFDDGLAVDWNGSIYKIELDFEEDDDCIIIGGKSKKAVDGFKHDYKSEAYDIEDMNDINSLEIVHCEII